MTNPDPQHSLDTSPEILAEEENQEVAGMHNGQQAPVDDDFDDFAEEQEGMGDDDFGDFDDGFQGPSEDVAEETTATPPPQSPGLPVVRAALIPYLCSNTNDNGYSLLS